MTHRVTLVHLGRSPWAADAPFLAVWKRIKGFVRPICNGEVYWRNLPVAETTDEDVTQLLRTPLNHSAQQYEHFFTPPTTERGVLDLLKKLQAVPYAAVGSEFAVVCVPEQAAPRGSGKQL